MEAEKEKVTVKLSFIILRQIYFVFRKIFEMIKENDYKCVSA